MFSFIDRYEIHFYTLALSVLSSVIYSQAVYLPWRDLILLGILFILLGWVGLLGRMSLSTIEFRADKIYLQSENHKKRDALPVTVYSYRAIRRFTNTALGVLVTCLICTIALVPEAVISQILVSQFLFSRWYQRSIGYRYQRIQKYAGEISTYQVIVYSVLGILYPFSKWIVVHYL